MCFIAPSYIVTTSTTAATIKTNNETSRSLLYGAGAIGAIITIFYIIYFIYSWTIPTLDIMNPASIAAAQLGYGSIFFIILIMAMFIFMIFLIIYAISLIDTTVSGNESGRWWAIAAVVLVVIAFLLDLINIFFNYGYYNYIASLTKTEEVVSLQPVSKPSSLADIFYFSRNPNTKGKFNGTIALEGELKEGNQFIEYNGQIIENLEKNQVVPIKVKFPINEISKVEIKKPEVVEVTKPVVQRRVNVF